MAMNSYTQRDLEHEIVKSVDLEHEIVKDMLVEALQNAQEKHEQEMKKILKELHAEHERSLAGVVDRAVRHAIAEMSPASSGPEVLPVAQEEMGYSLQPDIKKKTSRQDEKEKEANCESSRSLPGMSLEQSIKDVNKRVSAVASLARADSMWNKVANDGWKATLQKIVENPAFDYFVATLIISNTIVIAIQTDMNARDPDGETPSSIRALDLFFTVFFATELTLRIVVERCRFISGRNKGWNMFDSFVVLSAIVEEFLSTATNATAIRVLRIMRLVRVIRVVRTLRIFNDLRAMVRGIFTSIVSLVWALVLLFIICFVFGLFITQTVASYRNEHPAPQVSDPGEPLLDEDLVNRFGSLLDTMYSLYQAITGGDDWASFANPLFEISPIMGLFFCLYIAFAVFAVLNVVTGVFVDNAIKANQQDADVVIMEQTDARRKHVEQVKSVFKRADRDGSGVLDWEEFQRHLDNPYVQAYFRQLDLDIEGNGAHSLFMMLDFDGSGTIDVEEFVFGCGQLKGNARSLDLARMGHSQRQLSNKLISLVTDQSDRLDAMFGNFALMLSQFRGLQSMCKKLEIHFTKPQISEPSSPASTGRGPPDPDDPSSDLPGLVPADSDQDL